MRQDSILDLNCDAGTGPGLSLRLHREPHLGVWNLFLSDLTTPVLSKKKVTGSIWAIILSF